MSLSRRFCIALLLGAMLSTACKEDIEPPPPEEEPPAKQPPAIKPIEIDPRRSITLKADRTITLPNLVFVIQNDAALPESFGVTLTCARPAADGSRLTFGKLEMAPDLDTLAKRNIDFASGSRLDPTGNGIFTVTTVYQPKLVTLKITALDAQEVRGTLGGEFYRFSVATPTARPTVLKAEGSFTAALVKK